MAEERKTGRQVLAAIILIVVASIAVCRLGSGPEQEAVLAEWICDQCDAQATQELDSGSPDCPKCEKGQLVQQVFFKCKPCGSVFEGYQLDWSPNAPRAKAKRAQADADAATRSPAGPQVLICRPGGKWAWTGSKEGLKAMRKLTCPKCGKGPPGQFVKQLRRADDANDP